MPKTCQCAVCGARRADVATILGQFACYDCLVEAAADAVDAGDLDEGTTLADGERYDTIPNPDGVDDWEEDTIEDVLRFVQDHSTESPEIRNGAVRFGAHWSHRDGRTGIEWHRVTSIKEARAALGY